MSQVKGFIDLDSYGVGSFTLAQTFTLPAIGENMAYNMLAVDILIDMVDPATGKPYGFAYLQRAQILAGNQPGFMSLSDNRVITEMTSDLNMAQGNDFLSQSSGIFPQIILRDDYFSGTELTLVILFQKFLAGPTFRVGARIIYNPEKVTNTEMIRLSI